MIQIIGQRLHAFVQKHMTFSPQMLIDIGCGPRTFLPSVTHAIPTLLTDGAPHMVAKALTHHPHAQGLVMDAAAPILHYPEGLALANMVFQWIEDWPQALFRYAGQIKALGLSVPIEGSFPEWVDWCHRTHTPVKLNPLMNIEDLEGAIQKVSQNFFLHVDEIFVPYGRPLDFAKDLKHMGAHVSLKNAVPGPHSLYKARFPHPSFTGITYRVAYILMYF